MTDALKSVVTRKGFTSTPQTEKADDRQIKNSAGGYTFQASEFDQLKRLLILGTPDGFYQPGIELAKENSKAIIKLVESSPEAHKAVVDIILEVSTEGRAPKQNAGVFALAVSASYGEAEGRKYALDNLSAVARTGTTLFMFVDYISQFRGWGPALRRSVSSWYTQKDTQKLAYQVVKYRSRSGYTHRDLFRLSHPQGVNQAVTDWVLGKTINLLEAPKPIAGYELAKSVTKVDRLVSIIKEYDLSWEMIPTEFLNEVKVWETLLDSGNVPLGALIRQLSRLTRLGVLKPLGKYTKLVVDRLSDVDEIKRARLHPVNLLVAQKAYSLGYSQRSTGSSPYYRYFERDTKNTWTPVPAVSEALDGAFRLAFQTVEPTGKNFLWAQDVSGSMGSTIDASGLTSVEAGAAMALTFLNTEKYVHVVGFNHTVTPLNIRKGDSVADAARRAIQSNFGSTDCAAAINYAAKNKLEVDVFIVCTDNETYAGGNHVHEALDSYNRKFGREAKLVVLATAANKFTIGDPDKPNQYLDLAGWDSAMPKLVTEFARGY